MPSVSADEAVTVYLDSDTSAELDALADAVSLYRSFVIRQAIEAYLATHRWQVNYIAEGLRQADAGVFASDDEVAAAYARWRRRHQLAAFIR